MLRVELLGCQGISTGLWVWGGGFILGLGIGGRQFVLGKWTCKEMICAERGG